MHASEFQAQYGKSGKAKKAATVCPPEEEKPKKRKPRSMPMDQQKAAFRADWHSRNLPEGAVLIEASQNDNSFKYELRKHTYKVTIEIQK